MKILGYLLFVTISLAIEWDLVMSEIEKIEEQTDNQTRIRFEIIKQIGSQVKQNSLTSEEKENKKYKHAIELIQLSKNIDKNKQLVTEKILSITKKLRTLTNSDPLKSILLEARARLRRLGERTDSLMEEIDRDLIQRIGFKNNHEQGQEIPLKTQEKFIELTKFIMKSTQKYAQIVSSLKGLTGIKVEGQVTVTQLISRLPFIDEDVTQATRIHKQIEKIQDEFSRSSIMVDGKYSKLLYNNKRAQELLFERYKESIDKVVLESIMAKVANTPASIDDFEKQMDQCKKIVAKMDKIYDRLIHKLRGSKIIRSMGEEL